MIKAVIFDMDGVIIDSEMEYLRRDLEFVRTKNPDIQLEDLFAVVGSTSKAAWEWIAGLIGNGQAWDELREESRQKGNHFVGVDYRAIYRPQVTELLQTFKEYGLKLALASSTQMDMIQRVLQENEIQGYFDKVVSGQQFRKSKPDPEIYHYTANALGVKESECFVVEDSTYGIMAASRAGMKVAALIDGRFNFDQSLADYRVGRIEEILPLVEKAAHIVV